MGADTGRAIFVKNLALAEAVDFTRFAKVPREFL